MKNRIVEIGIKIDASAGVRFFGADEVNALISDGWRVTSIRPGGAIFKKFGAAEEAITTGAVNAVLSGFDMKVAMEQDG